MLQDPRLQHQQQQVNGQQQHFQQILERTQRMQQNNLQQQQLQQQHMAAMQQQQQQTPIVQNSQLPHPPNQPNLTAPSPQQQGQGGPSQPPMVHHSSPIPGQNRMSQGPTPPAKSLPNVQTIIDNFPTLYRRKHSGQLAPEQEHLVSHLLLNCGDMVNVDLLMKISLINSYAQNRVKWHSSDFKRLRLMRSFRITSQTPSPRTIKCHQ